MELFTPEIGLMFWMLIPFLIVFFILAKYGWPAIIKGVEERGKFIDDSIKSAKEANEKLAGIKEEGDRIIAEARNEQLRLLKEAAEIRDKMVKEAKQQAIIETDKAMQNAKIEIQHAKDDAVRDIRRQVAELSLDIAEKIIRKNLDNKSAQMELIDKLLDEASVSKS